MGRWKMKFPSEIQKSAVNGSQGMGVGVSVGGIDVSVGVRVNVGKGETGSSDGATTISVDIGDDCEGKVQETKTIVAKKRTTNFLK